MSGLNVSLILLNLLNYRHLLILGFIIIINVAMN